MSKLTITLCSVIFLLLISLFLSYVKILQLSDCQTSIGLEKYSPDKTKNAVLYNYSCDVDIGHSTQISIVDVGADVPNETGNVFSFANGKIRGHWLGPYVEFEWISNEVLQVRSFKQASSGIRSDEVAGIKIQHKTIYLDR